MMNVLNWYHVRREGYTDHVQLTSSEAAKLSDKGYYVIKENRPPPAAKREEDHES